MSAPPPLTDRPWILIVEDTPLNRDLLGQILEDHYALDFAFDGFEALTKLTDKTYDLVLLDISIPKIHGLEVVRRIRRTPKLRQLPVIAVTAHGMQGDRERILEAGCDEHILKPIDEDLLMSSIELHLKRMAG